MRKLLPNNHVVHKKHSKLTLIFDSQINTYINYYINNRMKYIINYKNEL
jgi:hypothetical protein